MVPKKKTLRAHFTSDDEKSESTKDESKREPVITQVVEVIEIETIPNDGVDAAELDKVIEKEEKAAEKETKTEQSPQTQQAEKPSSEEEDTEDMEDNDEAGVKESPRDLSPASLEGTEKQKQVVEELFKGETASGMSEISIHRKSNSSRIFLWIAILLGIAVGVGAGLMAFTKQSLPLPTFVLTPTTPTPVPSLAPTPTLVPTVNKVDAKLQVLNGGGKAGAGSKMKAALEGKGYTVSDVGNAEEYTYETTEVVVKEGQSTLAESIITDLGDAYKTTKSSTPLPANSEYDAQVIVGKE